MLSTRRSSTQARGRLRRKILLNSVRVLLADNELDKLSLGDVAEHAGVPKGSAYHFFASIYELYAELGRSIADEIREDQMRPHAPNPASWSAVISAAIERGVQFFNNDPAARQLLLGPKSPPEIKFADRQNDYELARTFEAQVRRHFILPDLPDLTILFFRAVEIADLMFCLSVIEFGTITPAMSEEAKKASIAYLALYLPPFLPPAPAN